MQNILCLLVTIHFKLFDGARAVAFPPPAEQRDVNGIHSFQIMQINTNHNKFLHGKILLSFLVGTLLTWSEVATSQSSVTSFLGRIEDKYDVARRNTLSASGSDYYTAMGGVLGNIVANMLSTTSAHSSYTVQSEYETTIQVAVTEQFEIGACVRITAQKYLVEQGYIEFGKAAIEPATGCAPLKLKPPAPPIVDNGIREKSGRPN